MNDIVQRLAKSTENLCTCSICMYTITTINDAVTEIERLRLLVQQLRPYMEMDMNSGLSIGPGPDYHYHPENSVKNCSDCEWYQESLAWKNRVESGELDV